MGITTKDLAQLCGVSRTTVHRSLYGGGRIHPDTKEMILRVAREHDYRPDLLARGLVKGRTYYIGVVVMDVKNRYFSAMLSAISREATSRGYNINIALHSNDRELERRQLMNLAAYRMDGIILSSVNEGEEYREFLGSLGMPIVSVDNRIADGIPFVTIDQREAMKASVRYALEKPYERVVFVCPAMASGEKENMYVHRERLKGFREGIEEAVREQKREIETICLLDWSYLEKVGDLIADSSRTAFVCAADEFALDIMKRLKELGKRCPADYGIIGFDNIDTLNYVIPRLATVSNAVDEIAKAAVNRLFERIEAGQEKETTEESDVSEKMLAEEDCILPYEVMEGETL